MKPAVVLRNLLTLAPLRTVNRPLFLDSGGYRRDFARYYSSDDGNKKEKTSKDRLHDLLKSMVEDSKERKARGDTPQIDFKLAVQKRPNPNKPKKEKLSEQVDPVTGATSSQPPSSMPPPPKPEEEEPKLSPQLLSAVKSVATTLDGNPEVTENELVQKLKAQQTEKINLSEIFLGMKIDRTKKPSPIPDRSAMSEGSRAHRVRQMLNANENTQQFQPQQRDRYSKPPPRTNREQSYAYHPVSLFGAPPIGIFTRRDSKPQKDLPVTPTLTTWDKIHEKELKLWATHPPANGFEEMILWTEQGKLWHFPIDNEQGNDENSKYDFTDHVFLEPVIESWCPKSGPIRQFMELVTVALSKNPYLTVPEKHEYLTWYHEYFKGKSEIIKSVGAGEIN